MLNNLLTALNDCVWAFDIDTQKFLFISPSIHAVLEYSIEDFQQNTDLWKEGIDPHDLSDVLASDSDHEKGVWVEHIYRVKTRSGKIKWVLHKKCRIDDEQTGHQVLLNIIKDISEQVNVGANGQEQFLASLIDSQTNFLVRIDNKGHYTFANRWFFKTLGYKRAEIIGKHFSVTRIPEESDLCEQAFINCIKNPGKIINLQHRKLDVKGNFHWIKWEFIAIKGEDGNVAEIQGIGQEVTQSIEIEKEVKKSVDRLNSFIESITDSFFIINNDWKFIKVNSAFEKITGKSREKIIGGVIGDIFPSIVATAFEDAYRKAMSEQASIQFTEYFEPINKWFNATVYPSSEGLTVFVRDITYEKHAQEEVVWTKNNLEALINNTEDLIWSIDRDGKYVYMNAAYRHRVTYSIDIIPKEGDDAYIHSGRTDKINKEWRSYYQRAFLGERYVTRHKSPHPRTKELTYFEVSFNPIYRKSKGEIIGVGCFARDITERLKTEKALIEQNERLRNIASLSSHELRRPVASMMGLINIIDKKNFANPDNAQIIEHLVTVSNEIDEVIRVIVNKTFIATPQPL